MKCEKQSLGFVGSILEFLVEWAIVSAIVWVILMIPVWIIRFVYRLIRDFVRLFIPKPKPEPQAKYILEMEVRITRKEPQQ